MNAPTAAHSVKQQQVHGLGTVHVAKAPSPVRPFAAKPQGVVKNARRATGVPTEIKAYIRANLTAVLTYIDCLEDNDADTTPTTTAAEKDQVQESSSMQPVSQAAKNLNVSVSSYQVDPVQAAQAPTQLKEDLSFLGFLDQGFNGFNANADANAQPAYTNVDNAAYKYVDITEADDDDNTPRPAYPSRQHFGEYAAEADTDSVAEYERSQAPRAVSLSQNYQQRAATKPATTNPLKRKREHPSQLQPTTWLPPLSPAQPWLLNTIDHATTNPGNEIRAHTIYPTPSPVLLASKSRANENMSTYLTKAAAGLPDEKNRVGWTLYEDDLIIKTMLEIRTDPSVPQTEKRFDVCAERIDWAGHGLYPRSHQAIKNMWCRVGRCRSGYDERKGFNQKSEHARNGWKGKPGNTKADKEARKVKKMRVE